MRIPLCLVLTLTLTACPTAETPEGETKSAVSAPTEPETPKATAPETPKATTPDATAPKAEDPTAKWRRQPQKKVPAPPDVRKPKKKGAKLTMAGVRYRVLKRGEGETNPTINSTVTIHYTGWTTKGRMFDSTLKTGEPATFGLRGLIDGWKDVIQHMAVGDVIRAWIPEKLAYKGKPGRPAGTLVFDIELLHFE
ncbi:MAG: FKBP-type peptidyl-prolyl cis-trans isomerase [Myxococcota bacterium]|nr:FKBP-type peptidyl-prolyl cis-trans isomerase [Myxococcota bacterium]